MVNEVIMYQSMFLLGIIAFGVFSFTFNVYTDRAEELTFESNIDLTNQKIGTLLLDMIAEGEAMQSYSNDFEIKIYVYLDSTFARKSYFLELEIDVSGQVILNAITSIQTISSFNTGQFNSSQNVFDDGNIIVSDNPAQFIYYTFSSPIATIGFGSA